jgi:hypothetical protein
MNFNAATLMIMIAKPVCFNSRSLSTRLYYLSITSNDTMTGWPRPNMEGKLDLINNSLKNLNRKLAIHRTRRLHEFVIMETVPKSEQQHTLHLLEKAWASANKCNESL